MDAVRNTVIHSASALMSGQLQEIPSMQTKRPRKQEPKVAMPVQFSNFKGLAFSLVRFRGRGSSLGLV